MIMAHTRELPFFVSPIVTTDCHYSLTYTCPKCLGCFYVSLLYSLTHTQQDVNPRPEYIYEEKARKLTDLMEGRNMHEKEVRSFQ